MKKILFLTTDFNAEIAEQTYEAILKAREKMDFKMDIFSCFGGFKEESGDLGEYAIHNIPIYKKYDGIIIMASQILAESARERIIAKTKDAGVPIVSVNIPVDDTISVGADNYQAESELVEHLITEHGAKKFAFVTGVPGYEADMRKQALLDTCHRHRISDDDIEIFHGDWLASSGTAVAEEILAKKDGLPDAIVCANDEMAIGVIDRLFGGGVRVPEDVLVTGFDGIESSILYSPSITTVGRDMDIMIEQALKNLFAKIDGKSYQHVLFTPHRTYYRTSCGCATGMTREDVEFHRRYTRLTRRLAEAEVAMDHMTNDFLAANTLGEITRAVEHYADVFGVEKLYCCIHAPMVRDLGTGYEEKHKLRTTEMALLTSQERRGMVMEGTIYEMFKRSELLPKDIYESKDIWLFYPLHYIEEFMGYAAVCDFEPFLARRQIRRPLHMLALALDNLRKKVRLTRMNRMLGEKADRDPLTGLYNRYGFSARAREVIEKTIKSGMIADMYFIDVDDMKDINDTYGHGAGDTCLVEIANTITRIREKDGYDHTGFVSMRFGGDEFVVIARRLEPDFETRFKESLERMNALRRYPFDIEASIGSVRIETGSELHPEKLLKMADDRMYAQKKERRRLKEIERAKEEKKKEEATSE